MSRSENPDRTVPEAREGPLLNAFLYSLEGVVVAVVAVLFFQLLA